MKPKLWGLTIFLLALPLLAPSCTSPAGQPALGLSSKVWKITVDLSKEDAMFGIQSGKAAFRRDGVVIVTLDADGSKVPGVWRLKDGERGFSGTFELVCENWDETCGTLILRGSPDRHGGFVGTVMEVRDAPDSNSPTGFSQFNGQFTMIPQQ